MNISQNGINLIKKFEGCRLKAYKSVQTEIYYTIGYGHYGSDVKEGQVITQKEAESLLEKDLRKFVLGVNALLKVPVNQNQFDALVSFAYNCGVGSLQKSNLLQYINKLDFESAANEFDKWVHADGKVLKGLVNRRTVEKELFKLKSTGNISESKVVMWDGVELKKGQIGRVKILKPINLWRRVEEDLEMVRVLKPSEEYRVYGYDDLHGGQYNLGSGLYVTKMDGYLKYETPSKKLLEQVN